MSIKTKIAQIVATIWLINSSNRVDAIKILKKQIAELLEMQAKNLHQSLVIRQSELLIDFAKKAFLPAYSPNNPEKCVEEYLKSTNIQ